MITIDSNNAHPPEKRYDYMLQENGMETFVKTVGVLQSHTKYFASVDVAYFILLKLHNLQIMVNF